MDESWSYLADHSVPDGVWLLLLDGREAGMISFLDDAAGGRDVERLVRAAVAGLNNPPPDEGFTTIHR